MHYLVDNNALYVLAAPDDSSYSRVDMLDTPFYRDKEEYNEKIKDHREFKILQLLVDYGANIEAVAYGKVNILHLCINANNFNMLQILLEHPAYKAVSIKLLASYDCFGNLPLHYTIKKDLTNASKYLIDKLPQTVEYKDIYGSTALMVATLNGNTHLVDYLCNMGAKVNEQNDIGQTSLHIAVVNENLPIITKLLGHGANPFFSDQESYTPFYIAISQKNQQITKVLADHILTYSSVEEQDINSLLTLAEQNSASAIFSIIANCKAQLIDKGTLKTLSADSKNSDNDAQDLADAKKVMEVTSAVITETEEDSSPDSEISPIDFGPDYLKKIHTYYQEQKKNYKCNIKAPGNHTHWYIAKQQKITDEHQDLIQISDSLYVLIDDTIIGDKVTCSIITNAAKKGLTSYGPGIKKLNNKLYEIKIYEDIRLYTCSEYVDYTGKFKLLYFCHKTDHKGIKRLVNESHGIEVIKYFPGDGLSDSSGTVIDGAFSEHESQQLLEFTKQDSIVDQPYHIDVTGDCAVSCS